MWLILSCVQAEAGFITDREDLHRNQEFPWTYNYFHGGGYYFHYRFRFTSSPLAYGMRRYHISRTISLYYVSQNDEVFVRNGQVILPAGHSISKEEYKTKLFNESYKIKEGGLLAEILGAAIPPSPVNAVLSLATSEETYNLDSNYSLQDFQIQVSQPGRPPLRYWNGLQRGISIATVMRRPGHTAENTSIMYIEPNTHLILGLPTMLNDESFFHERKLALYEATHNLQGHMELLGYHPLKYGARTTVQLILTSHEVEQHGGGEIEIMINDHGIIWRFRVRYNGRLRKGKFPRTPHYYPPRRDDYGPPPGGASGKGGGFFPTFCPVNVVDIPQAYHWLLLPDIIKKDWLF